MKRSKRKKGSSFTKALPLAQRQDVELRFPLTEEWNNIVHDFNSTPLQADMLKFTVEEARGGIGSYLAKLKNQPTRPLLINRLKEFEKALARLHDECRRSADLMHDFLPHGTLGYVGRSLTFAAMGEALGKNVIPPNFDHKIEVKRSVGERITLEFMEEFSRPSREALGLRLGHVILTQFVERIHAPLAKWIELKSFDKGGRAAGFARRYLIYRLAKAAPEIVGKPAMVAVTGTFADLCTAVALACGLLETGIAKAIPVVVRKLRGNPRKLRADHGQRRRRAP
jgi:hypothetical protein